MFDGKPMDPRVKHMRNVIAERALKRGRKWTAAERFQNLEEGLGYQPGGLLAQISTNPDRE